MANFHVAIPPIKSQGIKSKLIPWISSLMPENFSGKWIEPFMGTGVVGFNLSPEFATMADTNPHLINFYIALQEEVITPEKVASFLAKEGQELLRTEGEHYYKIRDRFNKTHNSLDFLFLSRAGFNGMIRFNRKGEFNIPFCRKPNRFAQAYITKIVNQVEATQYSILKRKIEFVNQGFRDTILTATTADLIYCDPPYIARHSDYFNGWNEDDENDLFKLVEQSPAKFILSTWYGNEYRENRFVKELWGKFPILTREHFYHVGAKEQNRAPMQEALIYSPGLEINTNAFKKWDSEPSLF